MKLSEGTPGHEERYDALNDSANPPLSSMRLADLIIQKNPNQGRNQGSNAAYYDQTKKAQTFSFNQMGSTVKMSELRLKLQLDQIATKTSHKSQDLSQLETTRNVFIIGNDWEVLVWGWKCNTVKID